MSLPDRTLFQPARLGSRTRLPSSWTSWVHLAIGSSPPMPGLSVSPLGTPGRKARYGPKTVFTSRIYQATVSKSGLLVRARAPSSSQVDIKALFHMAVLSQDRMG